VPIGRVPGQPGTSSPSLGPLYPGTSLNPVAESVSAAGWEPTCRDHSRVIRWKEGTIAGRSRVPAAKPQRTKHGALGWTGIPQSTLRIVTKRLRFVSRPHSIKSASGMHKSKASSATFPFTPSRMARDPQSGRPHGRPVSRWKQRRSQKRSRSFSLHIPLWAGARARWKLASAVNFSALRSII